MKKLSLYFILIAILVACNSTKHVKEGEFLLRDNFFIIDSVKTNASNLQKYVLQKPNSRFLGLPLGLYIHNLGNPDKPKTPTEWAARNPKSYNFIKKIFSEKQSIAYANSFIKLNNWYLSYPEPEVLDITKVNRTANNLNAYFKTEGFFKANVKPIIKRDSVNKKANVTYQIVKGKPTILDTINIYINSPILDSIYKDSNIKSLLVSGNQYKDETFRNEASKVVKLFRNNGIYFFSESALGFYVDDETRPYKSNVYFIISGNRLKDEDGKYVEKPYRVHSIRNVNIYTDYSYEKRDEPLKDTISYNGINFLAHERVRYNPKYLGQSVFMKPGGIYKDTLINLTRNHLKSLKNFKTTNINFSQYGKSEDELNMDIFLSPLEKYTIGLETELTHSNIRNIGVSGKFSLTNRNTFKGAEIFKMSFLGTWFNSNNGPGWEIGADASIEIPRFLAPFGLNKLVPQRMSPKTLISLGTSFQKNIGLDRQTFTFLTDFKWQYDAKRTIEVEVFNTQYIKNLNVDSFFNIYNSEYQSLNDIAQTYYNDPNRTLILPDEAVRFMNTVSNDINFQNTNPLQFNENLNILNRYKIITSDFIIPTIAYSFTYNNQLDFKDKDFSFFKFRIANSGNIIGLLSSTNNSFGKKTFLDIPLAQYFKTDIEYKKFWGFNNNSVFAIRTFLGAIITYDNSDIPFVKSYFAGGSNDIRAWQTYELGPGRSNTGLEFNVGSLKFLTSAEYRFDMFSRLKGAIFIDAGNIWDISGSEFVDEGSRFNGFKSIQDIAIGSGFGARLDFSFLILRFDVGFKTYEPYLNGNKWFRNYNFSNAVYNIGINYPF
ncbi:MAG: hypothetical protein HWD82_08675 [Flavobacteriaceae bacterium]|nr:hypothetical protein [Flavobacteriaceae bacterium]